MGAGKYRVLVAAGLIGLLASCSVNIAELPVHVGPALDPSPLPDYYVGETYEFDNGRIDTVVATEGDKVVWRNKNGVDIVRYRNFTVPDLRWKTATRTRTVDTNVNPAELWPLVPGKTGKRFVAVQKTVWSNGSRPDSERDYQWQCRVTGTEAVTVPAGSFETFLLTCFRFNGQGSFPRLTRTYYYAPSLGYFVKVTDKYATGLPRSTSLVSAGFNSNMLPRAEEADLVRALFSVLDTARDGVPTPWTRPDGSLTVTLTPLATFSNAERQQCRTYQSTYRYFERMRSNQRTVCRLSDGRWRRSSN